jgi:CubicO group peptidase (beta-lactamase class C family)
MLKKLTVFGLALIIIVNIVIAQTLAANNNKGKGKQSMPNETAQTNNPLTKEQERQIDALFTKFDHNTTPGCVVGIIQNGRFIYKKSFGLANLEYAVPITADSKFELGSTSKQFTAACIALLQLEGKISLDDDVRKYIPELPDYGNVITIRHLLYHTSGLRDHVALYSGLACGMTNDNYLSMEDAVKLVCRQKQLNFKPGEKHSYSNSGYLLLAEIISRVSKKKYSEYVKENIFSPLNMLNSSIDEDCRQVVQNRVSGYNETGETIYSKADHNSNDIGAKGVLTTMNDLLMWDDNFYSGKVGGKGLTGLMQTQGLLDNKEKIDYGYGLFFQIIKICWLLATPADVTVFRLRTTVTPIRN